MIIEFYALKCFFLGCVITFYLHKKWIKFNECKMYEIKRIKKEGSPSMDYPSLAKKRSQRQSIFTF